MDLSFWHTKWAANDLGFHQAEVEPLLIKYFSSFFPSPSTVLVPLCGKSRDMVWLADRGWKVVGVEASAIACRAFFEENGLAYEEVAHGPFTLYRGERVTLWCGDFFAMERKSLPELAAIYDRAALIALPPELREKYGLLMRHLLTGRSTPVTGLLIVLEYRQELAAGPPFSVELPEVQRLFSPPFQVTELERNEKVGVSPKFKTLRLREVAYRLEVGSTT